MNFSEKGWEAKREDRAGVRTWMWYWRPPQLICPYVRNPWEDRSWLPGSKQYPTQHSPPALNLFSSWQWRRIFPSTVQKALYALPVCCLNSASHCSSPMFLNDRCKSQHEAGEEFRRRAHSQQWDLLQRGELSWPDPAASSDLTSPMQYKPWELASSGTKTPLRTRHWEGENLIAKKTCLFPGKLF